MKLFWTILKTLGIIAGSISVLYGVFTLLDDIRDDVVEVKEDFGELRSTNDSILIITKNINKRLDNDEEVIRSNTDQVRLVTNSYLKHLENDSSLTKGVFIEYMEPFMEYIKKNSTPVEYSLTPLEQIRPGIRAVLDSTTLSSSR